MIRAWLRARSACTPPFPVLVCGAGVRAGIWVSAAPRHSFGGVGVCVCSCVRPARSPAPPVWGCCAGVHVRARALLFPCFSWPGCAVWACVLGPGLGCAPPFLVGLSGCELFFCISCFGFVAFVAGCPCPGPCGPCPPIPFLSGWVAGSFFFFQPGVCLRFLGVPLFGGPLFLAWCCRFLLGGPPVPLWGSCLWCLLGERFGRLLWCWQAGWWLWAVLSPLPPLRPLVFFSGGGGLRVPPSAFPGLAHALVRIQCGLLGCCWRLRSAWLRPGPMGRVGYVHVGLGAPSCRVRSWLCRLGGCARRLCGALG